MNPVPTEVDALRFKCKGKGKSKDHKEKGTDGKSPDTTRKYLQSCIRPERNKWCTDSRRDPAAILKYILEFQNAENLEHILEF